MKQGTYTSLTARYKKVLKRVKDTAPDDYRERLLGAELAMAIPPEYFKYKALKEAGKLFEEDAEIETEKIGLFWALHEIEWMQQFLEQEMLMQRAEWRAELADQAAKDKATNGSKN